jgi:hypothetical protein
MGHIRPVCNAARKRKPRHDLLAVALKKHGTPAIGLLLDIIESETGVDFEISRRLQHLLDVDLSHSRTRWRCSTEHDADRRLVPVCRKTFEVFRHVAFKPFRHGCASASRPDGIANP